MRPVPGLTSGGAHKSLPAGAIDRNRRATRLPHRPTPPNGKARAHSNGHLLLDVKDVVRAIRRAVAEEHDVRVHTAVLLRAGRIPKTTSGKVQRHACQAGFLGGTLEELV